MIKVKDLANGYTIEYDNEGFSHQFLLKKDGAVIKQGKTQEMLEQDAETYPKAYLELNGFRYEFSRPCLKVGKLITDVEITEVE